MDAEEANRKVAERNRWIATLMSAVAEVPDTRFAYAGLEDAELLAILMQLVPNPGSLALHTADLERVHKRGKIFADKVARVASMSGYDYAGEFSNKYLELVELMKAEAPGVTIATPFGDDLHDVETVMARIRA
ncbi:MAG: hypothetical protein WBB98_14425 [Xanthobacteraceae bacterium]